MIGRRLKLARGAAGLSLRALEAAIQHQVTAQAIGKYERDAMMPSSPVLIAMAKVLGVSVDYLLSEDEIALEGVDFRKHPETGARDERAVQAIVLDRVERYLALEGLLHLPSAAADVPRHAIAGVEDAEDAAKTVRTQWKLGHDPIPDLAELLEEHGIKVIKLTLPAKVFGSKAMVRRADHPDVPVIVVNEQHTGERQRFTLAHELAHLVLESSLDEKSNEKAADRFGGAFLMPADSVNRLVGKSRSELPLGELVALKKVFGVSVQTVAVRCHQLGIVSTAYYQRLYREFDRLGYRKPPYDEPAPLTAEEPKRLERLCFRAIAEDVINESRAAEILGWSRRKLEDELAARVPRNST